MLAQAGICFHFRAVKKDEGPGPDVLYEIALTLIPRIGPVRVRSLVSHCGSARQVFREKKSDLMLLPDIGVGSADAIMRADVLHKAEEEIAFMERAGVRPLFFTHPEFPKRLLQCADAPAMLYIKGNPEFDRRHVVSIVGTRSATEYGRQFCEDLIADLAPLQPVIVSGLAYGIDICAHRAALQSGLSTIACLAHGLDRIYPPLHAETAKQMLETGGWVTENISGADPERESFPMRNRIIAGLADCTVVVESDKKGGSMLTAYIAESYGRSVFALPGSIHDRFSQGPHQLIRKQVATLITSANDLKDAMSWTDRKPAKRKQASLFPDLSADETMVLNVMEAHGKVHLDDLAQHTSLSHSRLSGTLLELEFKGLVKSLPGKTYAMT